MKTQNNLINSTRKYRLTKRGVIRNIYAHIKERCNNKGRLLEFNSDELMEWCLNKKVFHDIYEKWRDENYTRSFRPSIDRIDPLKGYLFSNIQITTYQFNRDKGDAEKEILCGKPIIQCSLDGKPLQHFKSIKEAVSILKLNQGLICMVLSGQRNHTGGYKFIRNPSPAASDEYK